MYCRRISLTCGSWARACSRGEEQSCRVVKQSDELSLFATTITATDSGMRGKLQRSRRRQKLRPN
eukprot:27659-Eustigmatos_ZCMA.PRE.1